MMIGRAFDAITTADIQALVDNGVSESRVLEYKQNLPGTTDEAKREFLADVSSFANAGGGDILYGIVEKRDTEGRSTGEPEEATGLKGLNIDSEKLRLDELVRSGIDPRIPQLQIRSIDGFPLGPVLLIRVPPSWRLPHMVTFKNLSRFYSRNNAGKYQLDVAELRSAFLATEGITGRVTQFRDERLARIVAGDIPIVLPEAPIVVLHLVPLARQETTTREEISLAAASSDHDFWPLFVSGYNDRYNLDGVVKYYLLRESGKTPAYLQIFRSGAVESVYAWGYGIAEERRSFDAADLESEIIRKLVRYLQAEKKLGVEPPFIVMLSFIGVKGYSVGDSRTGRHPSETIDRDFLLLPDIVVEESSTDVDVALRPILDALWQASGWDRCRNYNAHGRHISVAR